MARTAANLDVEHMLDCRLSRRRAIVRWDRNAQILRRRVGYPTWEWTGLPDCPPSACLHPIDDSDKTKR
jgi:hypothetical protein